MTAPPPSPTQAHRVALYAGAALVVFVVSQVVAWLVNARLPIGESHSLAPFLWLTHIRNEGGIFGSFQGSSGLFAVIGVLLAAGMSLYVLRSGSLLPYQVICFGIIVGAAASNVCDRLVYGAVVDYIDVRGIPHWHYIFNIADASIHAGVWPMVIGSLLQGSHDRDRPR